MDKIKVEPERIAIGGEYRPVTVLFANFYGIDEIIEQLGEACSAEITAILNAHFTTMGRIIAKYGGVVNKVDSYAVGHRIMALFGAPRAHVDDPERAVRAALEMQAGDGGLCRAEHLLRPLLSQAAHRRQHGPGLCRQRGLAPSAKSIRSWATR